MRFRHAGAWVPSTLPLAATVLLATASPASAQFQLEDPTAEGEEPAGGGSSDAPGGSGTTPDADGSGDSNERPREDPPEEEAPVEEEAGADSEEDTPDGSGRTTVFGPQDPEEGDEDSTFLIPPVLFQEQGGVETNTVFPFFFQRSEDGDQELVLPPLLYYQRRSYEQNSDVVFPFFWSTREVDGSSLVIPPLYYSDYVDSSSWGFAPLVFHHHSEEEQYTVLPPLLTFAYADEDEAYTFAGPFWRVRDELDVSWGIFPFLWVFGDEYETDIIAPPFLFRFEDADEESALTIVPPVYVEETSEHSLYGLAGLAHYYTDDEGFSLTLPPLLFHYSQDGEDNRLVTPLFLYFDLEDESTLITPLYQNHRGETDLDAVAPLFFWQRDPRQRSSTLIIPPLLFGHSEDPSGSTTVSFPFFAQWHETGRYTTWITPLVGHHESHEEDAADTWVFPTLQFSHDEDSSTFNLHPLIYSTEGDDFRHLVIAPIWWDFEDEEDDSRDTVLFPFFWRFRDGADVSQVVLNTYYREYRRGGIPGWEFHFFPFFAYGEPRPGDHWWSVFYGLAGYRRSGRYAEGRAFWIPFEVDSPD